MMQLHYTIKDENKYFSLNCLNFRVSYSNIC